MENIEEIGKALKTARTIESQFKAIRDIGDMLSTVAEVMGNIESLENRRGELHGEMADLAAKRDVHAETVRVAVAGSDKELKKALDGNAHRLKVSNQDIQTKINALNEEFENAEKLHTGRMSNLAEQSATAELSLENIKSSVSRLNEELQGLRSQAKALAGEN